MGIHQVHHLWSLIRLMRWSFKMFSKGWASPPIEPRSPRRHRLPPTKCGYKSDWGFWEFQNKSSLKATKVSCKLVLVPRNLSWNLKIMVSKRTCLFQGLLFRFHVKFRGCTSPHLRLFKTWNLASFGRPEMRSYMLQGVLLTFNLHVFNF